MLKGTKRRQFSWTQGITWEKNLFVVINWQRLLKGVKTLLIRDWLKSLWTIRSDGAKRVYLLSPTTDTCYPYFLTSGVLSVVFDHSNPSVFFSPQFETALINKNNKNTARLKKYCSSSKLSSNSNLYMQQTGLAVRAMGLKSAVSEFKFHPVR